MKIVIKSTREILGEITTNRGMTLDEALDFLGIKVMKTKEDYINGDGYDYDDLMMVF